MKLFSYACLGFPGNNFVAEVSERRSYLAHASKINHWSIQQIQGILLSKSSQHDIACGLLSSFQRVVAAKVEFFSDINKLHAYCLFTMCFYLLERSKSQS